MSGSSQVIGGNQQQPIVATYTSFGSGSSIDLLDISYADLTIGGTTGLAAMAVYNLGAGTTVRLLSNAGMAVNPTVNFASAGARLVLGGNVDPTLLRGITGFRPGATIDVSALVPMLSYADAAGAGTGGTLTLQNAQGGAISAIPFSSGEYSSANFHLRSDGAGGTLIEYATAITAVTATPGSASLSAGGTVVLRLGTTDAVTVTGGTPALTLNDGAVAVYSPALSTPTSLAFTYTVAAGENTPDLAVTGIALNNATLGNAGNSFVNLSGAVANPDGTLQIDTTAPTLAAPVTNPGSGDLGAGKTVQLTMAASEAVTVTGGTPSLTLNDGGVALYSAALSMPTSMVFLYTVLPGQNTADLAVTAASLNGATVMDAAGNAGSLAAAVGNPSGTLQIDTTPPAVTGVGMTPNSGTLGAGQVVSIGVSVSEPVSVLGGVPSLALNDGGVATYDAANSSPTRLVFTHTILPGQSADDLSVTGAGLNGASIVDAAGNALDLTVAIGDPAGTLQVNTAVRTGSQPGTSTVSTPGVPASPLGVYRFFDKNTGTHFFTADVNEKTALGTAGTSSYRADMTKEVNGFGAIDPSSSDPNRVQVFRFFDTVFGTHFFTANQAEADALRNRTGPDYRPDLVFEPGSSFYEHGTQQAGDVAVYRFFDSRFGTHFYTGDQSEYAALTALGTPTYRPDLVSEGVGFYAPAGTFT